MQFLRSRVRFTLRRLMVAVAIVSLLLAAISEAFRLSERRAEYLKRAAMHVREAKLSRAYGILIYKGKLQYVRREEAERRELFDPRDYLRPGPDIPSTRSMILKMDELGRKNMFRREWHDRMRQKYERAARYPWLPVDPDTPEPG